MEYEHDIDDTIFQYLFVNGKQGFGSILSNVQTYFPKTTARTLNVHLKNLKEKVLISRDPPQPAGGRRNCWLTDNTRLMMLLGYMPSVESQREDKNKKVIRLRSEEVDSYYLFSEDKKRSQIGKKVQFMLLFLAAKGFSYLQSISDEKAKPGDIRVPIKNGGGEGETEVEEGWQLKRYYNIPGVSTNDLFSDYRRDVEMGHAMFQDIRFRDKAEIENLFNILTKFHPPLIGTIAEVEWIRKKIVQEGRLELLENEGRTRYAIYDENLSAFYNECLTLYFQIKKLIQSIFVYKKSRGRLPDKVLKWYEFFHGEKETNRFARKIEGLRFELRKYNSGYNNENKNKQENIRSIHERIKLESMGAYKLYCIITGDIQKVDKYSTSYTNSDREFCLERTKKCVMALKKYHSITQPLLEKIYPRFIHDFHTELMMMK